MAKLILTIEPQFQNVEKSIEALKTKIESLVPSFSMKGAKVDSELIKGLEQLKTTLKTIKIDPTVTNGIKALTDHYKQLGIVVRDIAKEYAKLDAQQRKQEQIIRSQASNVETVRKGYANLIATLKTLKGQYSGEAFGSLPEEAQKSFKEIEQLSQAFEKNKSLSEEEAKSLARLSQQLKKLQADLATLKAKNERIVSPNPFTVTQAQQIPKLTKQYSALLNSIKNVEKYYPKGTFDTFKNDLSAGLTQLNALNTEFKTTGTLSESSQTKLNDLANGFNQLNASVAQTQSTLKSSKGSLKDIIAGFLKFQLAAMLVMKPLQMIRSALTSINETLVKTEDAVIALQRVLPSGSASDNDISSRLYKIAQDYGQTFENVSQVATNFARAGMSWADTIKATEAAVLALNVAELDATEASDGMIAILTQFGLEAEDLTLVVDKLNITADNAAVTTEKLLAALQRTGSAASNANLSLDETLSIITALSEATGRSGQNLGTALNSLIQYSSKASALDTFAKLSDDTAAAVAKFRQGGANILEVWQSVSKEIQNLKSEQADLLDNYFATEDGNALKEALDGELEDIYTELGGVYDTANTFRKNYFIALLGNMDTVEKAMGTLQGAAGYSQDENQKYLKTYTALQNSVQAKWQKIANDAQGILGLKKNLLGAADGVLTLINYTGKLNTVFLLAGAALNKLAGAKIADSLAKQITSWSSLSRVVNAQAKPAVINYTAEIKRLKAEIFTTVDSETLLAKQTELLALKQQRLATVFKSVSTAISATLIVFAALNAIQGLIDEKRQERIEKEQEELRLQNEAIAKSVESIDSDKKLAQSTNEYADTVEQLRQVLDSSTASESEKQSAQSQLLSIQNSLIQSNADYASSLDLINGKLVEQLELVEKMSDAQLKKQAQQFLDSNYAEIANANSTVNNSSSTSVEFLTGSAFDNDKNKAFIQQLIQKAKEQGIELGADDYVNVPTSWTTPITYYEELIRKAANGQETTVWDWLGFTAIKDMFSKEGWEGSSWAGISASGTVDEQLKNLQAFRQLIIDSYSDLGLTYDDSVSYVEKLDAAIAQLNTTEYQNAKILAEKAKATEDFIAGTISREEYLKIVYGIESDIVKEEDFWHNNIAKVTTRYDGLISKLEELRDLQKESTEWEEKKLAVLEAEQALENAKNEATVRRFNQATGQWEWQTDEKKIAEAEKNLEQAQLNLQEASYNTIIDQLKEQTATNDSILAILKEVAPLLGEDFSNAVQNAIKDKTGVDITKPIVTPSESHDNGGLALGKGFINKATDRPESVNNPELTKKILSPVSNAEFNRYVRDMGIMFERSHEYAQVAPIIERVGGATDNRVDNSGQITMNGVTIGSDKRGSSLNELLSLANIVPNV